MQINVHVMVPERQVNSVLLLLGLVQHLSNTYNLRSHPYLAGHVLPELRLHRPTPVRGVSLTSRTLFSRRGRTSNAADGPSLLRIVFDPRDIVRYKPITKLDVNDDRTPCTGTVSRRKRPPS